MDFSPTIETVIAIVGGVIVPIVVALGTYIKIRGELKNADQELNTEKIKDDSAIRVESIAKAGDLAMQIAQFSNKNYSDCMARLDILEKENTDLRVANTDFRIRARRLLSTLRDIINEHEELSKSSTFDCPGFPIIQGMIMGLINEMEREVI